MRGFSKAAAFLSSVYVSASIVPRSRVAEPAGLPDHVIQYGKDHRTALEPTSVTASLTRVQMSPEHPSSSRCPTLSLLVLSYLCVAPSFSTLLPAKLAVAPRIPSRFYARTLREKQYHFRRPDPAAHLEWRLLHW